MLVLAVLIVAMLLARTLGLLGVDSFDSWPAATRAGLSAMFLFTSVAHFNSMRFDLARMLPPIVRRPILVIYFSGICEILGAIALLLPRTRMFAAVALVVFLVAVLPANIRAANANIRIRGKRVTPLGLRIPIQLLLIVLTWWSGIFHPDDPLSCWGERHPATAGLTNKGGNGNERGASRVSL